MKIYGAGSLDDVRRCTASGASGILTNPQGFEQYYEGRRTLQEITEALLEATHLPVYIQVHGESAEVIVACAKQLAALSDRVGFKIISDPKGFEAITQLQADGIRCIATALFSVAQAAAAAASGAFGICPFVGRGQEIGIDGADLLRTIRAGYDRLEHAPEVIAVSLKSVSDVTTALRAGADAVGMRWPLLERMMTHPLSEKAELLFAKNWQNVKGENVDYLSHALAMEGEAE